MINLSNDSKTHPFKVLHAIKTAVGMLQITSMGCVSSLIYRLEWQLNFYNCRPFFVAIFCCYFFLTCTHGWCVEVPAPPGAVDSVLAHQAVAAVTGESR